MKTKTSYYFDHLPKTGGTTVYQVLKSSLGANSATNQITLPYTEAMIRYGEKRLISCHTTFTKGDGFDQDRYYFTLLRNPLDRALSHYWYRRSFDYDHGWNDVIISRNHTFEQMLYSDDPQVLSLVSNVQARHYAMLFEDADCTESALLDAAKRALDHFDLVGVNEELEDFLLVLGADCGITIGSSIPALNVTRQRQQASDLDAESLRRFEALNAADYALHNYAISLFRKQRSRILSLAARQFRHSPDSDTANAPAAEPTIAPKEPHGNDADVASLNVRIVPEETGGEFAHIATVLIKGHLSETQRLFSGEKVSVYISYSSDIDIQRATLSLDIHNDAGQYMFGTDTFLLGHDINILAHENYFTEIDFRNDLAEGVYFISVAIKDAKGQSLHTKRFTTSFLVGFIAGYQFYGMFNLNPQFRILSEPQTLTGENIRLNYGCIKLGVETEPLKEFSAQLKGYSNQLQAMPNELLAIEIHITNTSSNTFPALGSRPVQVGARYFDQDGQLLATEDLRTVLPRDIGANESMNLFVHVRTLPTPGKYTLRVCLVQEFVAWFDDHQTGYADFEMVINPLT